MASLSDISIKRPVLATIMSLVIILFGVIGFQYLGVREYPSVDNPIITVTTTYVGANADVIEQQLTEVIEESVNGIAGIRTITSVSRDGRSIITVEFNLETDLEAAANDVRDRVSRVLNRLPPDADPPTVAKADADANPIVYVGVRSDQRNLLEITDLAVNVLKERLQTIPGVSVVQIWGEKKYSMRLWMDPARLASYQITPQEVVQALNKENVELPSGSVDLSRTELSIRTIGRLYTPEEFNELIIKQEADRVVKFKDIGNAEYGPENERVLLKSNGVPMVGVVLVPQPGVNQIAIAQEFYKRVKQIQNDIPQDYKLILGFDTTEFIQQSISEVEETIIISFGLVVIVIFLFLRDWRTTLIPVVAIPISLVGTFFVMYLLGFSINILTLLGIVLAIGLVVDDAIVVLENIYSKIEEGVPVKEAAIEGSREIYFAVISTTVVLCAVFLPVVFLQGISGRLFREFGITIASAVVISAFVSLSLTPMMSSRLLRPHEASSRFYQVTERFFVWINKVYETTLRAFMQVRWASLLLIAGSGGLIVWLGASLPSELAPQEDRAAFRVVATGPEGANFEYMSDWVDEASETVIGHLDTNENRVIVSVASPNFGSSGANNGFVRVILTPAARRQRSQQTIVEKITPDIMRLSGARAFVAQDQSIGASRGIGALPLQYVIQAPTLEKLKEVLPAFMDEARKQPEFAFVDANLRFNKPELRLEIDRDKARNLGVSVQDIAQTIQLSLAGQRFGYFIREGKQYQVIGQLSRENRNQPSDIRSLYVKNNRGDLVQLDNVIKLEEISSPPAIYRFNRYVAATVSAQLKPGISLGQGIDVMDGVASRVLDESVSTSLDGAARDFRESSSSLLFSFLMALVLIYLVLGAQFESFVSPIIILFTVPLALLGALASLWVFNQTLNIFSQIGIIMLIGLVTKNGILIVEFANQRMEAGLNKAEAAIAGATTRFRPILMTSLCTILGILPIALALGAGSESRVSMGIAVVGGMTVSTFLTLYIVPAIYTYLTREHKAQPAATQA